MSDDPKSAEHSLRIIFAGTPEFSLPALKALLASEHQVVAACTQPDRPAGRGRKLQPSPVKQVAEAAFVPVLQPVSLRNSEARAELAQLRPDLMVVVAYGLILPAEVLSTPRLGCWNIHASLLPRWRGAAPIHRAILAGDRETGVCIMQMDEGLDTGDILLERRTPIRDHDSAALLHDRLAELGAEALMDALRRRQELNPRPQHDDGATYAGKLDKSEADLDWSQPASQLDRQVRAFNPWPVARGEVAGELLRIWQAEARPGGGAEVGEVLRADRQGIDVMTGSGVLRLIEVQRSGGRRINAADYLNARPELRHGQA